jgi:peptide/nickel transport system substrate-binding protein
MSLKFRFSSPKIRLIAITTSALLAIASFAVPNTAQAASVFKVATSAAVTTWDPIQSFSTEAFYMTNIYEPLLWKNPDGVSPEYSPALATSWSSSTNGKTWTFKLRAGATFHDGSPVTSAAVKASLESSKKVGGAGFIWDSLKTIDTPSDDTVVINLSYAAPMDLIASSTYGAYIVNPKSLEAVAKDSKYYESGKDGGSGPYTISSYKAGSSVVLSAYAKHWASTKPAYSTIDISIVSDGITAQQMMTSGQVDWATNIPLTSMTSFKRNNKYKVIKYKSPFNYVGYFNTLRAPLNNPKVRQALSLALNYRQITAVGGQGYATQARGPVPAGIYPYDSATPQYQMARTKAKQLLASAGVKDLTIKITYASENSAEARFVPLIKDAFESIGVKAEVQGILFNQQWSAAKKDPANAQDLFIVKYWPTYSDAGVDNLWSLFHSSTKPFFNLSYWKNPAYDKLVDDAIELSGSDKAGAQKLYSQAMVILYNEAPGLYLYDEAQVSVVPKKFDIPKYNINYPFSAFFAEVKLSS